MKFLFFTRFTLTLIASLFLLERSEADSAVLNAQISNQTRNECVLISQETIHGILYSSPPLSLLVNQSMSFDIGQKWFSGPDEELNYQCGSLGNVKFKVSQPFGLIMGQTPAFQVIESHGITASLSSITDASALYGNSGLLNIELKPV